MDSSQGEGIHPQSPFVIQPDPVLREVGWLARLVAVIAAAILAFFIEQLSLMMFFGSRPQFGNQNFVGMNLLPLIFVGLVSVLTKRVWLCSGIATVLGLIFILRVFPLNYFVKTHHFAQLWLYGTSFLIEAVCVRECLKVGSRLLK